MCASSSSARQAIRLRRGGREVSEIREVKKVREVKEVSDYSLYSMLRFRSDAELGKTTAKLQNSYFFQKYFADTKICTIFAPANEKFRFGKLRYIAGWSSW